MRRICILNIYAAYVDSKYVWSPDESELAEDELEELID